MSRTPRNLQPESFYHIYNRGNNKEAVLRLSVDKQLFVSLLFKYEKSFDIKLVTYCVMDNHYHLILRTGKNPKDLSKYMHKVGTCYSVQINRKYQRIGHVFQGRFNANLLRYKRDRVRAANYIRKNPVQEGLVRKSADYPWSKKETRVVHGTGLL